MTNIKNKKNTDKLILISDLAEKIDKLTEIVVTLQNQILADRVAVNNMISSRIGDKNYIRKNQALARYRTFGKGLTIKRLEELIESDQVKVILKEDSRAPKGKAVLINESDLVRILTLEEREKVVIQKMQETNPDEPGINDVMSRIRSIAGSKANRKLKKVV